MFRPLTAVTNDKGTEEFNRRVDSTGSIDLVGCFTSRNCP